MSPQLISLYLDQSVWDAMMLCMGVVHGLALALGAIKTFH